MEEDNKHDFPDFGPDDDTEEMNGTPIYRPIRDEENEWPSWEIFYEKTDEWKGFDEEDTGIKEPKDNGSQ